VKTMSDSIDIEASPMIVWAVLTDLGSYPAWNPLFPQASGQIAAGQVITLKSVQPGGRTMTVKPTILAARPGAELAGPPASRASSTASTASS
jgi:Polyketide cyclase / dehydrase and lipid transport